MAFDDLTPNQTQRLAILIEALNTGNYTDEFIMGRRVGQHHGFIHLYGKGSISDYEIEGFTDSDIQALKEEGYITLISGGRASLKPKAYQQYKQQRDPLNLFQTVEEMQKREPSIYVFISHSSKDRAVAAALIDLLRAALSIPSEKIRCTSVDGYRLPAGASTDEQLRQEIYDARAFIGLITPTSLQSTYVLFELGARWGASRHLAPVLSSGTEAGALRQPLASLNALSCDASAQVYQLVSDIASTLGINAGSPSAYQKYVDALIKESSIARDSHQSEGGAKAAGTETSIFTASEETDFGYIYKRLNRKLEVDFPIYEKVESKDNVVQAGVDVYSINLLNAIVHYVNKGYRYFEDVYFNLELSELAEAQPLVRGQLSAAQSYSRASVGGAIRLELHTYGLTRHTRVERFRRPEDLSEFTEKVYRFKYWLDYSNHPVENLAFEFVSHAGS